MKQHNKLVRDKIPEIIEANGDQAQTRILDNQEYLEALDEKLQEEITEYLENNDLNELADVQEVIQAIIVARGGNPDEIEQHRIEKRETRGGFDERIFLESTS